MVLACKQLDGNIKKGEEERGRANFPSMYPSRVKGGGPKTKHRREGTSSNHGADGRLSERGFRQGRRRHRGVRGVRETGERSCLQAGNTDKGRALNGSLNMRSPKGKRGFEGRKQYKRRRERPEAMGLGKTCTRLLV